LNRNLETTEIIKVYFKKAPFLLGEVFFFLGIYGISSFESGLENILIALLFSCIGGYFVIKKTLTAIRAKKCMKDGLITKCIVEYEGSTFLEHNGRSVTKYTLAFKDKERIYYTYFWSAYHRDIRLGMSYTVYYLQADPNYSFVPDLYNIYYLDASKYRNTD